MRQVLRDIFGKKREFTVEEARREATMRAGIDRDYHGRAPRDPFGRLGVNVKIGVRHGYGNG